jgi:hypothetical protein
MYNPAIGRFLQTDPIGYTDGINWYTYCANNPIMFVDPWGLCGESRGWIDRLQTSVDVIGVADPTPISDGLNALVYLIRGKRSDAFLSAVSMLAYVGDAFGKGGKVAKGVAKGGRELASEGAQAVAKNLDELSQVAKSADEGVWELVSAHAERATRRGARKSGVSIQEIYRNTVSGQRRITHTVVNDAGRVVDGPHYRPFYKPRVGE